MSPSLSLIVFVVAAALAVVGQLLVLRDGLAGRTPAAGTSVAARVREALWITIPALALGLTLWGTWRALPSRERVATPVRPAGEPVATRPVPGVYL